ncbi:MAG: rubrerythrin family protein [Candidatus Omnitrophica bacterium]|nr:rubrerythrin family protein [Candidatus Omnitrophota bacterium]
MTAFAGESNAHAKYLKFAKKADEEGYGQVASLFRAAARAEQIHFERHAKEIQKLGGAADAKIIMTEVKSTKENLETALKGETYESTEMYPSFLKQAQKENNSGAASNFEDAAAAEAVHAKWYKTALKNLDAWKGGPKEFMVCPVCGNVVDVITGPSCTICMEPTDKFISVI